MLRKIHSLPGLFVALLLVIVAISGAALSVTPAVERLGTTVPADGEINVAALVTRVGEHHPGVEQIQRSPSGSIVVYYSHNGQTGATRIDPSSGESIGQHETSAWVRWTKNLHRSLLADTSGRVVVGLSALAMLVLSISGVVLLVRQQGGWRQLVRPVRGDFNQRWHTEASRLVVLGLLLSAVTGLYMSAATFEWVPDGLQDEPDFPTELTTGPAMPIGSIPVLQLTDINDLRELVYPLPGNDEDFYSFRTTQGDGYIDQATGELLTFEQHSATRKAYELIYQLHTAEGLWWLGLMLGLCALTVPFLSATGIGIWWKRRKTTYHIANNAQAQSADVIILVGSENNSTWGFAKALHNGLEQTGRRIHTAPMNHFLTAYRKAQFLFVLAATYGEGDAPASANQFMMRLKTYTGTHKPAFAVLGFGDRQYPAFCQFAKTVHTGLIDHGWESCLDLEVIDRQSAQEFARWGQSVNELMGCDVVLDHTPTLPKTRRLELMSRRDYGEDGHTQTSILRFTLPAPEGRIANHLRLTRRPRFAAGDLLGVVPPGSPLPRFYSLASNSKDGFLEICVRRHHKGLCSQMLCSLQRGESINGFIRSNPDFHPASGRSPTILIGAGTGIGPLVGFIRNNVGKSPMYLYWGGRNPKSDFLYQPELDRYLSDKRLTQLHTAFSRTTKGRYVQDSVLGDAPQMRTLIEDGAQVLVCGGRAMASSVTQALNEILLPIGLNVQTLKLQGRYREDVF